jgi:hypothetical protein
VAAVGRDLVSTAEWHRVRDFAQEVRTSPAALAIQGEAGARTTGAAFEQARAYGRSLAGPVAVRYALEEGTRPARQVA